MKACDNCRGVEDIKQCRATCGFKGANVDLCVKCRDLWLVGDIDGVSRRNDALLRSIMAGNVIDMPPPAILPDQ